MGVLKTSGASNRKLIRSGCLPLAEEVVYLGSVESGRHGVCFGPAPPSDDWILRIHARVWLRQGGEPCSAAKRHWGMRRLKLRDGRVEVLVVNIMK